MVQHVTIPQAATLSPGQMVFPGEPAIPYVGPGMEPVPGLGAGTDAATLIQILASIVLSSNGPLPPPNEIAQWTIGSNRSNGLFVATAQDVGNYPVPLLHPAITPAMVLLYDFNDVNCFPLAESATTTPQVIPPATVISELTTVMSAGGSPTNTASVVAKGATAATAAPLNYASLHTAGGTGILFTDNNSGSVAEQINLVATNAGLLPQTAKRVAWAIDIETPATLSTGNGCLFCIGNPANPQVAFTVENGVFVCHAQGVAVLSNVGVIPAVSQRFTLGALYEVDENDSSKFWLSFFINGTNTQYTRNAASQPGTMYYEPGSMKSQDNGYCRFQFALPPAQPGNASSDNMGFQPADQSYIAFGPQEALVSGQWAFTAIGCMVADLTNKPQMAVPLFTWNSTSRPVHSA